MSDNIAVSIIVPVYLAEQYIKGCLDTLIRQTLNNIEIILIDDYSPDSCGTICDEYAKNDERIVVIHNKVNLKQGKSRNLGIDIARGEFLGFVDPDDWVDIDFFEKLYKAAIREEVNIVKAKRKKIFQNKEFEEESSLNEYIKKKLNRGYPLFTVFRFEHTTAIFRRNLIIKYDIRYPAISFGEDNVFLLQATYNLKSIRLLNDTFYYYRKQDKSPTIKYDIKYFDDIIKYSNVGINYINKYEIIDKYYDYMFHKFIYKSIEVYRNIEIILKSEERKEYCLIEIHQIALKYKYYNLNYLETCVLLLKSNRVDIKSSFYNKVFRIISIIKSVLKI